MRTRLLVVVDEDHVQVGEFDLDNIPFQGETILAGGRVFRIKGRAFEIFQPAAVASKAIIGHIMPQPPMLVCTLILDQEDGPPLEINVDQERKRQQQRTLNS